MGDGWLGVAAGWRKGGQPKSWLAEEGLLDEILSIVGKGSS